MLEWIKSHKRLVGATGAAVAAGAGYLGYAMPPWVKAAWDGAGKLLGM